MFLATATSHTFSPTVWVGGTATNDERTVSGAKGSGAVNDVAVLSGAQTGLSPVTTVARANVYVGALGPMSVVNWLGCADGDSGGPWLTTYSNGNVRAEGQHVGIVTTTTGYTGCGYMHLNSISSTLQASLTVG